MMEYKNYYGSVHYNDEDKLFYGKLEFIQPLVTYEGTDVHGLRKDFEGAVDDYLELCKEEKIEPEEFFIYCDLNNTVEKHGAADQHAGVKANDNSFFDFLRAMECAGDKDKDHKD